MNLTDKLLKLKHTSHPSGDITFDIEDLTDFMRNILKDYKKSLPDQYEIMNIIEHESKLDMDYHGIVCRHIAKVLSIRLLEINE